MANFSGVLSRLLTSLSTFDPTWDVSVGSATYKIMESVAQEISNANNNSVLQTYSYDINTKLGIDLDNFCNLFGVYRQLGKRSVGVVTFSTNTTTDNILQIPTGTQVAVPIGVSNINPIYFVTTAPAIIGIGETQVDVPVAAMLPGTLGNVAAKKITSLVNSLVGVTTVTNNAATSGGLDPENDQNLRLRWQSTAFNNITGTANKYVLTAKQNPNVLKANAFGPQVFYDEQLQILATVSGANNNTTQLRFNLVAYSGMSNANTGATYTGTNVVYNVTVLSGGSTSAQVASALQTAFDTAATTYGISVITSGTTVSGGLSISLSTQSPYRLAISNVSGTVAGLVSPNANGNATLSGITYREYIVSNNPDVGLSGTLSYNGTLSGYLFPQGNELLGANLNTFTQNVYANTVDYVYPTTPVAPLTLPILNSTSNPNLFLGANVELISEYTPAASRAIMPASGNYADVFINGTTGTSVTEQIVFNPSLTLSNGNANPLLNTVNYTLGSGTVAATNTSTVGDIYIPLSQQPLVNFPSQLSVSSSGIADTVYIYDTSTNSGTYIPICLSPYGVTTYSGTSIVSGTGINFLPYTNANLTIPVGLALSGNTGGVMPASLPGRTYITQVASSGFYINNKISYTGTVTVTGRALAYPLYDTTDLQGSVLSTSALAVKPANSLAGWNTAMPTGTGWGIYVHDQNSDVTSVEALVQQSRPIGVNTLVHQAEFIPLKIKVSIVFATSTSQSAVKSSVSSAIASYLANVPFLGAISFTSLASQILAVPGVANAKVTGVDVVATDGSSVNGYSFSSDFLLASHQLPSLSSVVFTTRGAGNF